MLKAVCPRTAEATCTSAQSRSSPARRTRDSHGKQLAQVRRAEGHLVVIHYPLYRSNLHKCAEQKDDTFDKRAEGIRSNLHKCAEQKPRFIGRSPASLFMHRKVRFIEKSTSEEVLFSWWRQRGSTRAPAGAWSLAVTTVHRTVALCRSSFEPLCKRKNGHPLTRAAVFWWRQRGSNL